jgi:hypothetical protein
MKTSRLSEHQIVGMLKQAEAGVRQVWIVSLRSRSIYVYISFTGMTILKPPQGLDGG